MEYVMASAIDKCRHNAKTWLRDCGRRLGKVTALAGRRFTHSRAAVVSFMLLEGPGCQSARIPACFADMFGPAKRFAAAGSCKCTEFRDCVMVLLAGDRSFVE